MKLGRVEICYIAPVNRSKRISVNYKRVMATVSTMIGMALVNINTYAAEVTTETKITVEEVNRRINSGGQNILNVGQTVGMWVAIVMAGFEIIKCIKDGDVNRVWGILTKYGMALSSLYIIEWLFKAIAGWFA